jgi:hypothetical protein
MLSLVAYDEPEHTEGFNVLLVAQRLAKVIKVTEDDIAVPLIDLSLAKFYDPGDLIWSGNEHGHQVAVSVTIIWKGRPIGITGAAVSLDSGLGMVLPRGTLG